MPTMFTPNHKGCKQAPPHHCTDFSLSVRITVTGQDQLHTPQVSQDATLNLPSYAQVDEKMHLLMWARW